MSGITPVWFITGASSGFGHEIALSALRRGHDVVATARNPAKIADLQNAGAHPMAFDVTSPMETIENAAAAVKRDHGRLDYLIHAAGYVLEGAVEELTPEEIFQQFNTNVFGAMHTSRAFLPLMRTQSVGPTGNRGLIATFGSLAAWDAGVSYAAYSMTKACASSLAEALRNEVGDFGIKACVIEPGYFRTSLLSSGAKISAASRLPAYEDETTATGRMRHALELADGHQLGDVKKGAEVIVDVLTKSGVAEGSEIPFRVVLGSDIDAVIRSKCKETIETLDTWDSIIRSTDNTME